MNKPYSTTINSLNDLQKYKGKEIGLSDWFYMSQDKINIFADITEDSQWIHLILPKKVFLDCSEREIPLVRL